MVRYQGWGIVGRIRGVRESRRCQRSFHGAVDGRKGVDGCQWFRAFGGSSSGFGFRV